MYAQYVRRLVGSVVVLGVSMSMMAPAHAEIAAGPVLIGKSISGVTLGMTKKAVIALLGAADEVPNDIYLGYKTPEDGLLQIFFDANVVTSVMASGSDFCVLKGPCLDSKGLIAALKKSNKSAKKVIGEDSDYLEITTKVGTKKTVTAFSIDGTTSFNVTIRR
jgi:hypothetical protein